MLEHLKEIRSIEGHDVVVMDDLKKKYPQHFNKDSGQMDYKWFESEIRDKKFIYIRRDKNSLSFTLEGENQGCPVECVITAAKGLLMGLQKKSPSILKSLAIDHLDMAASNIKMEKKQSTLKGIYGRS